MGVFFGTDGLRGSVNVDLTSSVALFLVTIIKQEQYKYSYGRAVYSSVAENIDLLLPIKLDEKGNPVIDEKKQFSNKGFIPDWDFMENYIKSLPYGDRI